MSEASDVSAFVDGVASSFAIGGPAKWGRRESWIATGAPRLLEAVETDMEELAHEVDAMNADGMMRVCERLGVLLSRVHGVARAQKKATSKSRT